MERREPELNAAGAGRHPGCNHAARTDDELIERAAAVVAAELA